MREPANKRMLTDVSGLRSHRCTIIRIDISPDLVESRVVAPPSLTWDIREDEVLDVSQAGSMGKRARGWLKIPAAAPGAFAHPTLNTLSAPCPGPCRSPSPWSAIPTTPGTAAGDFSPTWHCATSRRGR